MPRKNPPRKTDTNTTKWRDPVTGYFRQGHPGGLRRGIPDKRNTFERRVQAEARKLMMDELGQTAEQVVAAARAGDLKASLYMLDRFLPKEEDMRPMLAEVDLTSMEGVNSAVTSMITGVITGDNQPGEVKQVMDLLARLAGMKAQEQLRDLTELAEVAAKGGEQGQLEMDPELLPVWGRLVDGE